MKNLQRNWENFKKFCRSIKDTKTYYYAIEGEKGLEIQFQPDGIILNRKSSYKDIIISNDELIILRDFIDLAIKHREKK